MALDMGASSKSVALRGASLYRVAWSGALTLVHRAGLADLLAMPRERTTGLTTVNEVVLRSNKMKRLSTEIGFVSIHARQEIPGDGYGRAELRKDIRHAGAYGFPEDSTSVGGGDSRARAGHVAHGRGPTPARG